MKINRESGSALLYFCYGGEHRLTASAIEHSPWVNQGVSLHGAPNSTRLLSTVPSLGESQLFDSERVEWNVTCPGRDVNAEVEIFELWLKTEFTSPAYYLDISLGHHRLELIDISGNQQFQVIEFDEKTTLRVRARSFYTKEIMFFTATWKLGEEELKQSEADAQGWMTYDFKPVEENIYSFGVAVPSMYYPQGVVEASVPVHALAKTPWARNAILQINSTPVQDATIEGVVCARRNYNILSLINSDLLLKDSTLTLSSESDLNELGITIPELNAERPLKDEEMSWHINSSPTTGKSGFFNLILACSKLKRSWDITGRMISASLGDEVVAIRVGERPVPDVGAIFFREELTDLTLVFHPWMRGLKVALEEESSGLGITYNPPLKQFVAVPDDLEVRWAVTAGKDTGVFNLKVIGEHSLEPLNISSRVISKLSASEFESIKINGVAVTDLDEPELVFFREDTSTLVLSARAGGALPGMRVALMAGNYNPDLGMMFNPELGEINSQVIPESGVVSWTVSGGDKSDFFDLKFKFSDTDEEFPLPCRQLSKLLNNEADIQFDDQDIALGVSVLKRGETKRLRVVPRKDSPLFGLLFSLHWLQGTGLVSEDLICSPAFDEGTKTYDWSITATEKKSGTFVLELVSKWYPKPMAVLSALVLSSNLSDEATLLIDEKAVTGDDIVFSKETIKSIKWVPNSGSPIHELPLALSCYFLDGLAPGDVVSEPPLDESTTIGEWSLQSNNDRTGTFLLRLINRNFPPLEIGFSRKFSINYEMRGERFSAVNGVAKRLLHSYEQESLTCYFSQQIEGLEVRVTSFDLVVEPATPHVFFADYLGGVIRVKFLNTREFGWLKFEYSGLGLDGYSETIEFRRS